MSLITAHGVVGLPPRHAAPGLLEERLDDDPLLRNRVGELIEQEPRLAHQQVGRQEQTRGGKPPVALHQAVPVLLGGGFVRAHGEGGEHFEVFLRLVLLEARLGVVQPHELLEKRAAAGDEPRVLTELADKVLDVRRATLEGAQDRVGEHGVGHHEPLRIGAP